MGGVAQNTEVQGINAGRMRERLPTAVVALAWWDLKATQQPEQHERGKSRRAEKSYVEEGDGKRGWKVDADAVI